ncbi:MAG: ABC transporter permease, partial [Planctomycetes bacterium]|nr:ABC transporter permease [Planctomycetota bacterium]
MNQNNSQTTDEKRSREDMGTKVWKRFRRHPGAVAGMIVLGILVLSVTLVSFSPYDPESSEMSSRLLPPSWEHPFGTDKLGRDMLTRTLYGGRISLLVGASVVVVALSIGIPIGAVAGYYGGTVDNVLMRLTDAALSFPSLLVLILLSVMLLDLDIPFFSSNSVLTII